MWQRSTPDQSLADAPPDTEGVRRYVDQLLDENGRYVLGDERVRALGEVMRLCNEAGVQVVLMEEPLSEDLRTHYPEELFPAFHRSVDPLIAEAGLRIHTLEELGVELERADFREHSHVNLAGATEITRALSGQVLAPLLKGR